MTDVLKIRRIESLPEPLREDALLEWRAVADLWGAKDTENTRQKFKARAEEIGEKLIHISSRRQLPTVATYRKVTASLAR
jgi:hypothetical protein